MSVDMEWPPCGVCSSQQQSLYKILHMNTLIHGKKTLNPGPGCAEAVAVGGSVLRAVAAAGGLSNPYGINLKPCIQARACAEVTVVGGGVLRAATRCCSCMQNPKVSGTSSETRR